jgi:alpha-N-acetylglucosamine transferase
MITITEKDLQELREIVLRQKMDELFEEPSTYEDEEND